VHRHAPRCRTSIALVALLDAAADGSAWTRRDAGIASRSSATGSREPLATRSHCPRLAILVIACNAAMFGLSRLGYSLALNRQIRPRRRLHPAMTRRSC
jgi:hypothetical protein